MGIDGHRWAEKGTDGQRWGTEGHRWAQMGIDGVGSKIATAQSRANYTPRACKGIFTHGIAR